ncbi:hypothetical protein AIIKEEIJ_00286 [Rhodococcus sp. YH1]|nr:hypothetical protein [Rhodococcus sp. YH1]
MREHVGLARREHHVGRLRGRAAERPGQPVRQRPQLALQAGVLHGLGEAAQFRVHVPDLGRRDRVLGRPIEGAEQRQPPVHLVPDGDLAAEPARRLHERPHRAIAER